MRISRNAVLTVLLLLSIIFILLQSFVFSRGQIVYVDSNRLLGGYKAMIEARKEFDKKQSVWQNNVDSLGRDVERAMKSYEKSSVTGTDAEKKSAKELIASRQKEFYDYQGAVKQNAGQEEQKLTQGIVSTVNAYLLRYGKKKGYGMILIATNGNIGYAADDLDVTDKVVEELNKEYFVPVK